MIIKQTRIPVGQAVNLTTYLTAAGENETVHQMSGDLMNIGLSDMISGTIGRTYGTRHVIVSPGQRLNRADLGKVITAIAKELDLPESSLERMCIVRHEKQRADASDGARIHYHIAFPEVDYLTGRVLSSSFTHIRNEKVARLCELVLGHEVTPGRFNRQVYEALQADGVDVRRYEQALRDACRREGKPESQWLEYSARAAFTADTQHAAERKTDPDDPFRSPQAVREHIKGLGNDPAEIIAALLADGFEISPGRKPGTWIVAIDGVPFGSLARLAKLTKEAVNEAATERFGSPEIWRSARPNAPRRSRDERHRAGDQGPIGRFLRRATLRRNFQ